MCHLLVLTRAILKIQEIPKSTEEACVTLKESFGPHTGEEKAGSAFILKETELNYLSQQTKRLLEQRVSALATLFCDQHANDNHLQYLFQIIVHNYLYLL